MQVITGLIQKRTADTEYNVEQPFSTIYWRPQHIQSVLLKSGRVCKHLCSSRITQKLSVIKLSHLSSWTWSVFRPWSFMIISDHSQTEHIWSPQAKSKELCLPWWVACDHTLCLVADSQNSCWRTLLRRAYDGRRHLMLQHPKVFPRSPCLNQRRCDINTGFSWAWE